MRKKRKKKKMKKKMMMMMAAVRIVNFESNFAFVSILAKVHIDAFKG